jgi:hypothetical protein
LVALVVGQWLIDSYVWWAVQVAGVTVILIAAAKPLPPRGARPTGQGPRPDRVERTPHGIPDE